MLVGRGNVPGKTLLSGAVVATGAVDRVHRLGEREDISACLSAMDLFCLTSSGEGVSNVVGEAMAVGTPVLVTDVGDAALLVGDKGTVIPPNNPSALAKALAALIALPRDTLASRGAGARARIVQECTMARAQDRCLALYRDLLIDEARG